MRDVVVGYSEGYYSVAVARWHIVLLSFSLEKKRRFQGRCGWQVKSRKDQRVKMRLFIPGYRCRPLGCGA